jgi:hypothetical protein
MSCLHIGIFICPTIERSHQRRGVILDDKRDKDGNRVWYVRLEAGGIPTWMLLDLINRR